MTNKLFVGSLAYSVTDAVLEQHFSKLGAVLSARIITDRMSGQSKGFGFVEMQTPELAQQAIKDLNGSTVEGRSIVVSEAKPQEDRPRGDFKKTNDFSQRNNNFGRKNRY